MRNLPMLFVVAAITASAGELRAQKAEILRVGARIRTRPPLDSAKQWAVGMVERMTPDSLAARGRWRLETFARADRAVQVQVRQPPRVVDVLGPAGLSMLGGTLVGLGLGSLLYDPSHCRNASFSCIRKAELITFFGAAFGGTGLVAGAISGWIRGHRVWVSVQ